MKTQKNTPAKNIIICLDGTGNQFGEDLSNIVKLFRMLEREPGKQIAYYDPGVGTMGDPSYKTAIARKVNKVMGLAFGQGLMKNMLEAYTFLMDNYEDGDRVYLFGFSRGAYTARALAAFIRDCGLFEKGAKNLLPYAMSFFLKQAPSDKAGEEKFYNILSRFRSTYARPLNHKGDPRDEESKDIPNFQLRIHFMGLFDTVKSYGWVSNPVVLRNEEENPSVLNIRHAISIDERRNFFRQMHWTATKKHQTCKEVWFAGSHSDVGGGYAERDAGLAKIALEWMVHEAMSLGLQVTTKWYGRTFQKTPDENNNWHPLPVRKEEERKYSRPNPTAKFNESLVETWKLVQLLPKKGTKWEEFKGIRTIKSESDRQVPKGDPKEDTNPLRVHESVIARISQVPGYKPANLLKALAGDINNLKKEAIEKTKTTKDVFKHQEG